MEKFNMPNLSVRPDSRPLRWLLIVLMLALASCSSLRLVYNHGDTLLYWWIDGYVDLDPRGRPGLGAHLHARLKVPVIGVAKTRVPHRQPRDSDAPSSEHVRPRP